MDEDFEIDPVCAMQVDPAHAAGHSEYADRVYYFCSPECKEKFDLCPADFADLA